MKTLNSFNEKEKVVLISAIMYAGIKGFDEFVSFCKKLEDKDNLSNDDMKEILHNVDMKDELIDFVINEVNNEEYEDNKEVVEIYADNELVDKIERPK